jgi:hypothetical protein
METKKAESIKAPQNLDEFISRYAPLFCSHPNELVMVVERNDDDGFRGGPCTRSPWGDTSKGGVVNTDYYLSVIDPAKSFKEHEQVILRLPVGPTILVHLHGTHILEDLKMGIGLISLLKMGETLMDLDSVSGEVRLPQWEIFVGDEEVAKALERVHIEQELIAIAAVARKLGRPITGSNILDAACEARVGKAIDVLVGLVFGSKPDKLPRHEIEKCLEELRILGIDKAGAVQRCLEQLLAEIKTAVGLTI